MVEESLTQESQVASFILAAGRGSRMQGFEGNKTLLPLVPEGAPCEGSRPILLQIIDTLPFGPKIVVVHHRKQDIMDATRMLELTYCFQRDLNGTGGALLAARRILENLACRRILITLGDVPLVRPDTYLTLIEKLAEASLVVLGFKPVSKMQYGVLHVAGEQVRKIVEWKYWKDFPEERQRAFEICNSGIFAVRKEALLSSLPELAATPHKVNKVIEGEATQFDEYFITDLVEILDRSGHSVRFILAKDEEEVMGVDDRSALIRVQELYATRKGY
jgi:bifunctional UDP-N-acetylglucosamine pyrophosphorylase/glucosamine-1-phosphate N-acetyltransferase